jgi:hypothetical protein
MYAFPPCLGSLWSSDLYSERERYVFNEKRTDLMVAAVTAPDTKDVSQFLFTLIPDREF